LHWLTVFDQATVADLTKEQRKIIKDDGSKIIWRLLFAYLKELEQMDPWAEDILEKTKLLIPLPAMYLPYMIVINRFLEHHSQKTMNPTPLCTTHVPGSIMLNTAAVVDLVFQDKTNFDGLWVWMARAGFDLSQFKGKGDLYSSVNKFLPHANSSRFNTSLWQYVCRFHSCRQSKKKKHKKDCEFGFLKYGAMMFKNTVTTDSHKAGIHYVNEEAYLASHADCKSVNNWKDFNTEFPYVTKLPEQDQMDLMDSQKYRLLFVDPGKKNILTIGTGAKVGGVTKYTMVQRQREAYLKRNQDEYNGSILRMVQDNDRNALTFVQNTDFGDVNRVVTLETLVSMGYAQDFMGLHSSSNLERFRAYL
ncbi:hypothetical protein HDU81_000977, partial [Chytriomyces hyalinus]